MTIATTETQTQVAVPEHHAKRTDIISVTPENFDKFVDNKLGIVNESPEAIAAKELEKVEAKKASDETAATEAKKREEDPTHDIDGLSDDKKNGINERFKKAGQARKIAEEKAAILEADNKVIAERAAKAEKETAELKAKYEPVKTVEEIGAKPDPTKYTDVSEYSKDLEKWVKDTTLAESRKEAAERQAKEAQESKLKSWNERNAAAKTAIPDYEATINSSNVALSDQVRDAILDSEVGPQLLYHFAKNPDAAEAISKMTIGKALIHLGKIEAGLSAEKTETKGTKTTIAEISRAPAPITPIKAGTSVSTNKMDSNGEFIGTYEEYKALRRAGRI
jgi:hypothetical protein